MWTRIKVLIFGEASQESVPERVQEAIARQQSESEILIGWVQLFIVTMFGLLYWVSPKTAPMDAPIEPVPGALLLYFLFTLTRLAAAYKGWLPLWFLVLSMMADIGLLIGLIWSFHIQYAQPLALFLKAPTLLYMFIFIVLRALRFDARFVLLAGLMAAAGWGFLVWLSVSGMGIGDPITTDYVDYLTSPRVLIGGEFDKIFTILFVTGVLSLAIFRARRLLERAAIEAQAASDLSRFFAPAIADKITHAENRIRPGEGELRRTTVLFIDIRGFTEFAKTRPPQEVMRVLGNYETRMVPIIQRHGGTVDKFLGDGIMATFGAAMECETCAASSLRAIDDLNVEAERWATKRAKSGLQPFHLGFGLSMGEVVFGAIGHENRLEFTVIGDAVNLAAKLEKHNKTAGTTALTTCQVLRTARSEGYDGPDRRVIKAVTVEGTSDPLDLVVLVE